MKPAPRYYSSALSKFCAEELPSDFHFLDGDVVLFLHSALPVIAARESGILRIVESKMPNEQIRRAQRETLPLLAGALDLAISTGLLASGSGVFVVEGEPPYVDGALVSKVRPATTTHDWAAIGVQYEATHHIDREQLSGFIRCRRMLKAVA